VAKKGKFALADGGTIFLDEIGTMSPTLQAKLLRVLQEREFEPLGSERTEKVDLRVVAATNRDLRQMVVDGKFQEDLFYRLNVIPIELPPLRDRRDDIPLLVEHFVRKHAQRTGRRIERIDDGVLPAL
jgi:transcriptional regulator with GAF, ATPase, and Fis domain